MNHSFLTHIANSLRTKVNNTTPVSGGDISQAFKIETTSGNLFIKLNQSQAALKMFEAEKIGLQLIASTNTIATPEVLHVGQFKNYSYIILEYIESKLASPTEMNLLGRHLAQLHKSTSDKFGLESNNFIGSLKQTNNFQSNWTDFYCQERLIPQLKISEEKGLLKKTEIPTSDIIRNSLDLILQNVTPSLIHGDLWSGNYLVSSNGIPYLIDPSVYYGDAEVDIAMSKLFGGFGESFYESYAQETSTMNFNEEKIELYQLYYLLVHLNLFGSSYYKSVVRILKKYF